MQQNDMPGTTKRESTVSLAVDPLLRIDSLADACPNSPPTAEPHRRAGAPQAVGLPLAKGDAKPSPETTDLFDPELVRQIVRDSRRDQGLPAQVSDPGVIARLAVMVSPR